MSRTRRIRTRHKPITYVMLAAVALMTIQPVVADAQQRRGGGRSGGASRSSGNVNRSSPARSGSTNKSNTNRSNQAPASNNRANTPSTANRTPSSSNRTPSSSNAGRNNANRANPGRTGARRTSARRPSSSRARSRTRSRRVHRSRRYRTARWRHHRHWHHRRWYGGFWVGRVILRWATFAAIANSSTTVVVHTGTYYHYNPWYRKVLYEGEEGYVLTTAPVDWETDALPDGAETVEFEGATYYYADWSFFQAASGGGYTVVEPPVGAEVSAIPEEAVAHDEGDVALYQFDNLFFTKTTNDAGREVYRVEPSPPEEEIDSIPAGSVSFVADGETFYYVNYNLYVDFEENGQTGYVNGEPEIGAQLDELPEGTTTVEEDGRTFYQFDMVFFEEVEDEEGNPFYEVIESPDGSETVEL